MRRMTLILRRKLEIGLPLFERSRSGWSPTRAGQIYLSSARQILQIRQETDRRCVR